MTTEWMDQAIDAFTRLFPEYSFFNLSYNVKGMLAVILVSLICGIVGSLVVGNRMAFFSDALAHCAFAGVGLGLLTGYVAGAAKEGHFYQWGIPLIMILFGVLVGAGIHYVRERTGLASDTVIGVFFAGAVGFGAVLLTEMNRRGYFNPENFLFGDVLTVSSDDLVVLFFLLCLTFVLLALMYNGLVFSSFNTSLARSRRVPIRLYNYLFIVMLALIVNLCLKIVGALLINALLVVPAAAAANVCRNLRQLFWVTTAVCLGVGMGGMLLSWNLQVVGSGGTIVVMSVLVFLVSMAVGPLIRGRQSN